MDAEEHFVMDLAAGIVHRGLRDGFGLGQGDVQSTALRPQIAQGQGISLAVGREYQAEDEQHYQQGVEHPLPLHPGRVVLVRHLHHRRQDLLPQGSEALVRLRPWLRLRRTRPGHARRAPGQHPLPVRPQRVDVHVLRRFGRLVALRLAAARLPHPLPIRRLVAGPPVPLRVHIRFDQSRPVAMLALPVPGQLPQRQPQRMRGQILYLHPGEQQESRVPHHQPQVLAVRLALPADAPVPAGQVAGREVEQQAAQQAPLAVAQEIAQVRAEWLAVAEVVVALDPLVPLRDRFRVLGQFQPQRPQRSQRLRNRRLGIRAGRSPDGPLRAAPAVPLGWQGEDLELLEGLEHAEG